MKIKSYGQFGQDFFVARLLGFKTGGFFVDIGCGTSHLDLRYSHFASMSNTYLLEQTFEWKGVALDYDKTIAISLLNKEIVCIVLTLWSII